MERGVLPDLAELRDDFDIDVPATVAIEAARATACALCRVPPLDRNAAPEAAEAWSLAHDREPSPHEPFSPLVIARASADSRLEPRLPVPDDVLAAVRPHLGEPEIDALWRCIVAVCGRCAFDESAFPPALAARLEGIYVETLYDGNVAVARAQPSWAAAARLFEIVRERSDLRRRAG